MCVWEVSERHVYSICVDFYMCRFHVICVGVCIFTARHMYSAGWRCVCIRVFVYICMIWSTRVEYTCVLACVLYVCRLHVICVVLHSYTATLCNTLQHTTPRYNTLQHSATHRNTLHHTATHRNTPQHTATHRNTPQHPATPRNTLQHTAPHSTTPQHTAPHRNTVPRKAKHLTSPSHFSSVHLRAPDSACHTSPYSQKSARSSIDHMKSLYSRLLRISTRVAHIKDTACDKGQHSSWRVFFKIRRIESVCGPWIDIDTGITPISGIQWVFVVSVYGECLWWVLMVSVDGECLWWVFMVNWASWPL